MISEDGLVAYADCVSFDRFNTVYVVGAVGVIFAVVCMLDYSWRGRSAVCFFSHGLFCVRKDYRGVAV